MIYVIICIHRNRKLLTDRIRLKEQLLKEQDERRQYIHDKSGGLVMDIMLFLLLFAVLTAALFNEDVFRTTSCILAAAVVLKAGFYFCFSR